MTETDIPVLDVGGTHVTAALVDLSALRVTERSTRALDADGDADVIIRAMADAAADLGAGSDRAWGVAMPGPFDYAAGRGTFAGVDKFASLAGVDLRMALSTALATAPRDIRFVNDADAYALGEWDAQDHPARLMCATLGTGVGGGFIERGHVLTDDPRVPTGGDFYHLTWRGDPLEDHVSRRAFIRDFGVRGLDVKDIAAMALAGDRNAILMFNRGMSILAQVLAPWIDSFRPDVLVIGGAIARSWDAIGPALDSAIKILTAHSPEVRPSRLQDEAPLIGAAEFVRSPTPAQEANLT